MLRAMNGFWGVFGIPVIGRDVAVAPRKAGSAVAPSCLIGTAGVRAAAGPAAKRTRAVVASVAFVGIGRSTHVMGGLSNSLAIVPAMPATRPRTRMAPDERRRQILDVARRLFSTRPYG